MKDTLVKNDEPIINKSTIDYDTSRRITSLRFLLIVLVVFIHNYYTKETTLAILNEGGTPPIFVQNAVGTWIKLFITSGIARSAVPLFFLFSAYLQAKKNDNYSVLIKKRAKSLLLPYVMWIFIYGFYYTGLKLIVIKVAPHLIVRPENTCLTWSFKDWIYNILGYKEKLDGSGFELPGFAYQFWFVRDLIILCILSPIINYLIKISPVGFFLFFFTAYVVPVRLYFVENESFFYIIGYYLGTFDIPIFKKIDEIKWMEIIPLYILSFVATYTFFGGDHSTLYYIMVIFGCVILLKFSKIIVRNEKIYSIFSYLNGFSFFLFAIHAPLLNAFISKIWIQIFPMKNTFWSLCQYFIPTLLVIILGSLIGIILKKLAPHLFKLLNGGR